MGSLFPSARRDQGPPAPLVKVSWLGTGRQVSLIKATLPIKAPNKLSTDALNHHPNRVKWDAVSYPPRVNHRGMEIHRWSRTLPLLIIKLPVSEGKVAYITWNL